MCCDTLSVVYIVLYFSGFLELYSLNMFCIQILILCGWCIVNLSCNIINKYFAMRFSDSYNSCWPICMYVCINYLCHIINFTYKGKYRLVLDLKFMVFDLCVCILQAYNIVCMVSYLLTLSLPLDKLVQLLELEQMHTNEWTQTLKYTNRVLHLSLTVHT